jgi:hypothetical protein
MGGNVQSLRWSKLGSGYGELCGLDLWWLVVGVFTIGWVADGVDVTMIDPCFGSGTKGPSSTANPPSGGASARPTRSSRCSGLKEPPASKVRISAVYRFAVSLTHLRPNVWSSHLHFDNTSASGDFRR